MPNAKFMMQALTELQRIFDSVGPRKIWRPVFDARHRLLAAGIGDADDGLPPAAAGIDFRGKSVLDLGCNFGFYSFLARQLGARRVLGVDIDPRIIRGCALLKEIYGMDGIQFAAADALKLDTDRFDMVMMIDFIGKGVIQEGRVQPFMAAAERLARRELLLTVRPVYHIHKKFGRAAAVLKARYPAASILNRYFLNLDYIRGCLGGRWRLHPLSACPNPESESKEAFLGVRCR